MKEKCEKLFHVGELIKAMIAIVFVAVSVIISVLIIAFHFEIYITVLIIAFLLLCDVLLIFDYVSYRKAAFLAEISGDKVVFYKVGNTVEKNTDDCSKIKSFSSFYLIFFGKDFADFPVVRRARNAFQKKVFIMQKSEGEIYGYK